MNLHVIVYFLAGTALQSSLVQSHFTAFPHEHPHTDNFYHNPNPYQYHQQPAPHPEPVHPHVAPQPAPVAVHPEPAYHAEPAPIHPHQPAYHAEAAPVHPHEPAYPAEPAHMYAHPEPYQQPYGYQPAHHPGHYQEPYQYQHPDMYGRHPDPSYHPYNPYSPHHAAHPAHPHQVHAAHKPVVVATTPAPPTTPAPATTAVAPTPKYLGTFKNPSHDVKGDIFMLDQSTLYIQGFSFDGEAPDPYFWSDGIPIPYYTRSDPNVTMKLRKYTNEDVVLMLPPEKPTMDALGHFQVWCAMFNVVFGEFDMKDAHKG